MPLALRLWSFRRIAAVWGGGALLEAALVLPMFVLLVKPEPPLVARLRGEDAARASRVILHGGGRGAGPAGPLAAVAPPAPEDSFYTVLHWPLNKPLGAGGGQVIAMPVRLWWVPALYVAAVPLGLVAVSTAWLVARARAG